MSGPIGPHEEAFTLLTVCAGRDAEHAGTANDEKQVYKTGKKHYV